jgi:hypothetical protein
MMTTRILLKTTIGLSKTIVAAKDWIATSAGDDSDPAQLARGA